RHRGLHERRQVDAAQRAGRLRGGQGRGQAVRDPRPHQPPGHARRRPPRDPTRSHGTPGDGRPAIVPDPGGFIHKLPHQLVDAFRATLEEVNRADVLIEVVDASDAHATEHRATVQAVLVELGAGDKPRLVAYNKSDLL